MGIHSHSHAPHNISELSKELLDQLSDEKVAVLAPLTVVLIIFLLIGIPGNALVVYFFWKPAKRIATAVFILFLAMFDFWTCFCSMPVDVILLGFFLKMDNHTVCKVYKFANHLSAIGAALTLTLMAIDRYRRICQPLLQQITPRQAWIFCMVVVCVSSVLSGPAFIAYDVVHIEFEYGPEDTIVYGSDCHNAHDGNPSVAAIAYRFVIFGLFFAGSILLLVVYSMIGRVMIKKSREIREKEKKRIALRRATTMNYQEDASEPDTTSDWASFKKEMRYTINMVVVTALYIFSYIPYFSLAVWSLFISEHHVMHFKDFGFLTYEFAVRSFFLHPALNPVAYAIFHVDFNNYIVEKLGKMKTRILGCCSRGEESRDNRQNEASNYTDSVSTNNSVFD